ncbi:MULTISPECIES: hypothetical protein [unclassified Pseudoclavibacter]|uniref:hypothetical protein n=1 Tax=unclassified Pseudoclavibacter TaxID=2615177 RepID=UPI001BAAD62C|nr:hypothetical protein [Pseudoclavibacter sp. Marseille-Q4354]MBS3177252.1 hypothetical protein [Pseudoclavibacter sp. Marseille-Q4354]
MESSDRLSLILEDGRALLNGQAVGKGMSTPLGEFTGPHDGWVARADGVMVGDSGVFIANVQSGSVHLEAIEGGTSLLVGFLLDGALEVSSDADGTEQVEVGGGFAMRASTSGTFHWRQPSAAVMLVVPDTEGFSGHIGETVVRLDPSNALLPPVTAFLKAVATAQAKPSEQSAKLLEQLIRSQIDAVLLTHLAGADGNHSIVGDHECASQLKHG